MRQHTLQNHQEPTETERTVLFKSTELALALALLNDSEIKLRRSAAKNRNSKLKQEWRAAEEEAAEVPQVSEQVGGEQRWRD